MLVMAFFVGSRSTLHFPHVYPTLSPPLRTFPPFYFLTNPIPLSHQHTHTHTCKQNVFVSSHGWMSLHNSSVGTVAYRYTSPLSRRTPSVPDSLSRPWGCNLK